MDHIRQFDWYTSEPDSRTFLNESDLKNSVIEKILRNKYYDPLVSSESEDEGAKPKFNWDEIFSRKDNRDQLNRIFVPGLRTMPPYPKLSSLTADQHYRCLKVLCTEYPNVLELEFIPRPTKQDHRIYEEVKAVYTKEQQEYIEWAKTLWTSSHCIRALRPKPLIELVYEAEFKLKAHELQAYPKTYCMAAQIPLESRNDTFEIVLQKDLISVDVTELPRIQSSDVLLRRFTLMKPSAVPEVCNKHPCRFVLPNEKTMSILPVTEVHRELAQYALDNGAQCIASESALKCLLELDRQWHVPLSVCPVIGPDGDTSNVVVMGSEFSTRRQSAQMRTYKAFRHLLADALIPQSERAKILQKWQSTNQDASAREEMQVNLNETAERMDMSIDDDDDDEEDNWCIDTDDLTQMSPFTENTEMSAQTDEIEKECSEKESSEKDISEKETEKTVNTSTEDKMGYYSCNCCDTFERPPPRSFKKWQVRNNTTHENYDIIVHCSHKARGEVGEVILEPIPEYQIDLGGCRQSQEKMKSLALSLLLRKRASLVNARVDCATGDLVLLDRVYPEQFASRHGDLAPAVANTLHTALNQLQGLMPGKYVLQHEPIHGTNALLYVARNTIPEHTTSLTLEFDCSQLAESDESKSLKTPPTLEPVLLPAHKLRKILPCAFTPNHWQLAKEPKRPVTRQKTPPQALKYPKRKTKKKNVQ